jgi:lysophospholipase L1-like esterase
MKRSSRTSRIQIGRRVVVALTATSCAAWLVMAGAAAASGSTTPRAAPAARFDGATRAVPEPPGSSAQRRAAGPGRSIALSGIAGVPAGTAAAASSDRASYLALGDSYPFGPQPPARGYADMLAAFTGLSLVNAACPGETTDSMVSATSPDDGCRGYREDHPLKADYSGPQLAFAVSYLRTHPTTKLVTVDLGGNDFLFALDRCATQYPDDPAAQRGCFFGQLPGTLQRFADNLTTILTSIRAQGHYRGALVVKNITIPDFADLDSLQVAQIANQVMAQIADATRTPLADAFSLWQRAAARHGGDACAAGLLIRLSATACDVHPSAKGHLLLAASILSALVRSP